MVAVPIVGMICGAGCDGCRPTHTHTRHHVLPPSAGLQRCQAPPQPPICLPPSSIQRRTKVQVYQTHHLCPPSPPSAFNGLSVHLRGLSGNSPCASIATPYPEGGGLGGRDGWGGGGAPWGSLKGSARAVQLFGHLAVLETDTRGL